MHLLILPLVLVFSIVLTLYVLLRLSKHGGTGP